jgi:hypothetical protein
MSHADDFLQPDDYLDGEDDRAAAKRILTKAAKCLRQGIPATFTMGELDALSIVQARQLAAEILDAAHPADTWAVS